MKRAVILHGTSADHTSNWFPWLSKELENIGYQVWVPDLPHSDHPNMDCYNELLLNSGWDFNDNLVIGHSSGAVAILGLIAALPENVKVKTAILAGAFTKRLAEDPSWHMLTELFYKPFDFEKIKNKADQFIFLHSKDDPYCPIEQARELSEKLGGEFIEFDGFGHFSKSLDPKFSKFPELLEIIQTKAQ